MLDTSYRVVELSAAVVTGVCIPRHCTVVLVIRDGSSLAEVKVYMDLDGCQYPLGLLPRATVHFDRLQRKISMHGTVYFLFRVVSACYVVNLAGSSDSVSQHGR